MSTRGNDNPRARSADARECQIDRPGVRASAESPRPKERIGQGIERAAPKRTDGHTRLFRHVVAGDLRGTYDRGHSAAESSRRGSVSQEACDRTARAAPGRRELAGIVGAANVLWIRRRSARVRLRRNVVRQPPAVRRAPGGYGAEVSAIHRLATRERLALTPRAMGSGLSGGRAAARQHRAQHHAHEPDPRDRRGEFRRGRAAGRRHADLQRAVEARGLFYPPDPSSLKQSAIGGNVAENAGGARCLKYGVTATT
jgi:hypothetical protein